jgi:hypothetical protein
MIKYILYIKVDEVTDVKVEADSYESFLEKIGEYERSQFRMEHVLLEEPVNFVNGGLFEDKENDSNNIDEEEIGIQCLENERQCEEEIFNQR